MAAWIFAGLRKSLKASEEKAKQKGTIKSKSTGLAWKRSALKNSLIQRRVQKELCHPSAVT